MFELLDHAAVSDEALDQFEFNTFLGKDNHKGLQTTAVGGADKPRKQQSRASFEEEIPTKKSSKAQAKGGAGAKGFGAKK
jgi:hypothetical protein